MADLQISTELRLAVGKEEVKFQPMAGWKPVVGQMLQYMLEMHNTKAEGSSFQVVLLSNCHLPLPLSLSHFCFKLYFCPSSHSSQRDIVKHHEKALGNKNAFSWEG